MQAHTEPARSGQWHLTFLNVAQAHTISQGEDVVVAVVDTGVDSTHPDLAGSILSGVDLSGVATSDGRRDLDGHGTGMAGIIVAHGDALGIAPKAKILPVRDSVDYTNERAVPEAIDWAVQHGAKVLSLSLGVNDTADLEAAITRALDADVVVVAAAGNRPEDAGVRYPAAYPGVIAVAGIDRTGVHSDVSVTGSPVVLAAPGVDIVSTAPNNTYRIGTGTSDATAIVAGAAALVRAKYPDLSAKDVYRRLTLTAVDKGAPGRDIEYGFGVLDIVKALTADIPPQTPSASATIAAPPKASAPTATTVLLVILVLLVAAATTAFLIVRRRRTRS